MKHNIIIITMLLFPQFLYAQETKMEITLRDIYEELQTFKENTQKDTIGIKHSIAGRDEKIEATYQHFDKADQRFNEVNKPKNAHLHIILFVTFIIIVFFVFLIFMKLFQINRSISNIERFLTDDIKHYNQNVTEIVYQRT